MKKQLFLSQLRMHLGQDLYTRVILALHQDTLVWESIHDTDLGWRAIDELIADPEYWSPGALAIFGLHYPLSLVDLRKQEHNPDQTLEKLISRTYDEWKNHPEFGILTLNHAGTLALFLLNTRGKNGSWDSINSILPQGAVGLETILACLLGFVDDRDALLTSLLNAPGSILPTHAVLHAILANPFLPEQQVELVLRCAARASIARQAEMLRDLEVSRPAIARQLAQTLAKNEQSSPGSDMMQPPALANLMDHIHRSLLDAEISHLSVQPEAAARSLSECLKSSHQLQAGLAGLLAHVGEQTGDDQFVIETWKQALGFEPESSYYRGRLGYYYLRTNRVEEARSILQSTSVQSSPQSSSPTLTLAMLLLADHDDDAPTTKILAVEMLHALEEKAHLESVEPEMIINLAQLLDKFQMDAEAARAARLCLALQPQNTTALALLTHSELKQSHPLLAISTAELAVAAQPDDPQNHQLLIASLEAAGAWNLALKERKDLLQSLQVIQASDYLGLARCALLAGQTDEALEVAMKALELEPENAACLSTLGEIYLAAGQEEAALQTFEKATQIDPDLTNAWISLARLYKSKDDSEQAIRCLQIASQASPDNPEIQLVLGEAHLISGAPTLALAAFRKAASLNEYASGASAPDAVQGIPQTISNLGIQIQLQLGKTLHRLGHTEEASSILEKTFSACPDQVEVAQAYADVLQDRGAFRQALRPLETVVQSYPTDGQAYFALGKALLLVNEHPEQDPHRAIRLFQRAIQLTPQIFEAHALLAEAYATTGQYVQALQAYRQALESPLGRQPHWHARLSVGLGKTALASEKYEIAIASLQEAIQLEPNHLPALQALSQAYASAGLASSAFQTAQAVLKIDSTNVEILSWFADTAEKIHTLPGGSSLAAQKEAIKALHKALQISPQRDDIVFRLGMLQIQEHDQAGALETFSILVSKISSQSASEPVTLPSHNLFLAGRNLRLLGSPGQAVVLLNKALQKYWQERSPSLIHTEPPAEWFIDLAFAHLQSGNPHTALDLLEKAGTSNHHPDLMATRADILIHLNRQNEALQELGKFAQHHPVNAGIRLRLGLLYSFLGNLTQALVCYENILQAGWEKEAPKEIISATYLASDTARRLLLFDKAKDLVFQLLRSSTPTRLFAAQPASIGLPPAIVMLPGPVELACLAVEFAFDNQDKQAAQTAMPFFEQALISASQHPSCLAVHSRYQYRQGDYQAALQTYQHALGRFETTFKDANSTSAFAIRETALSMRRALAAAAFDLGLWSQNATLMKQVLNEASDEPLTHFQTALTWVRKAETQHIFRLFDVVQHAPGSSALDEHAWVSFDDTLQKAQQTVEDFLSLDEDSLQAANRLLTYWRVRGAAVFDPSAEHLAKFKEVGRNRKLTAYETSLLVYLSSYSTEGRVISWIDKEILNHPAVIQAFAATQAVDDPVLALNNAFAALSRSGDETNDSPVAKHLLYYLLARQASRTCLTLTGLPSPRMMIQAALSFWPEEPRWHALAAEICLNPLMPGEQAEPSQAAEHLEKAIQVESDFTPHYLQLGQIYLDLGKNQDAVRVFEQVNRISPEDSSIWMPLSQAYLDQGNLEQAARFADQALDQDPHNSAKLFYRGELALKMGDQGKALSCAQSLLSPDSHDPQAYFLAARAHEALDQPIEALAQLDKAIRYSDHGLKLQLYRVQLLRKAKGQEFALRALKELAEHFPEEPAVLAPLAEALMEAGQNEHAIQTAELALSDEKVRLTFDERAHLHFLVGRQLHRMGQLDLAIQHLSEAAHLSPGKVDTYLELGRVYLDRRQQAMALKTYQQAIRIAANDYRPYYHAGMALKDSKEYMEAEEMLRKAANLAPDDVSVHRQLGAIVALNLVHSHRTVSAQF